MILTIGIALRALYKICFLGLGQGRPLHTVDLPSLCSNEIVLQRRETLRHEGQESEKFILEKNGLGTGAIGRGDCRDYRHFSRK